MNQSLEYREKYPGATGLCCSSVTPCSHMRKYGSNDICNACRRAHGYPVKLSANFPFMSLAAAFNLPYSAVISFMDVGPHGYNAQQRVKSILTNEHDMTEFSHALAFAMHDEIKRRELVEAQHELALTREPIRGQMDG